MSHPPLLNDSVIDPDTATPQQPSDQSPKLSPPPANKPKLLPWLMGGVLLLGGSGYWWMTQSQASGPPQGGMMGKMPPAPVKWQTLEPTMVMDASLLMGTLEAAKGTAIAPEISGRIQEILVREGQRVERGQVLFRIDNDVLQTQLLEAQANVAQRQAELTELKAGTRREEIAQAQAELNQAQSRLANAKAGSSPEEIAQAQAQLDSAKAGAELANERVKRFTDLRDQGVIALDTYDERLTEQRQAIAEVTAAQRRLAQLKKARSSEVDRLTAEVEAQRQNLNRLQNGERPEDIAQAQAQVAQAIAQVKTLETRLAKTNVTAPFAGIVGYIPVKTGEYVEAGNALTNLTENKQLDLNLAVPLAQSAKLRPGLTVQILDAQENPIATGQVSFISPDVDSNGQSVLARATFQNQSGQLLNRQLVQARIIWDQSAGLTVPTAAVTRIGGEAFVYVVETGKNEDTGETQLTAQQKAVTLGSLQGSNYQILAGLQPGEKVITAGLLKIQDGAIVRPADGGEKPEQAS
ncbi:MAG: efflux RND transporter periplasmic adaptor subunit [Synechocystis sp.]|nr:efflux RND transporter periplasmic adaptor subunit [Synechocystis sp.]